MKTRIMPKVLGLGSNGSGQLGIGHKDDVSQPTACLFEDDDDDCGDDSTLPAVRERERERERERQIKRIACGGNHTLILFDDGSLYAAGLNGRDLRCGILPSTSRQTSHAEERIELNREEEEEDVLMRFRRVRLRLRSTKQVIKRFKDVCATWSATCFVATIATTTTTTDGIADERDFVVMLGTGDKGELGLGREKTITRLESSSTDSSDDIIPVDEFVLPDFPPKDAYIKAISSGPYHVVAILSSGDIYGWGVSRKGQLGQHPERMSEKIVWSPGKIHLVDSVASGIVPTAVSCGREFTFLGGYRKKLYSLEGHAESGTEYVYHILGVDDKRNIISSAPPLDSLQSSKALHAKYQGSTSWHGVYLHDVHEKSVIAWGRNDRGQLGIDPAGQCAAQESLVRWTSVAHFAAGSEHAVAVLSDNKTVVSCGWGEHGNCGPDIDERGNVQGKLSHIRIPAEILDENIANPVLSVAAGCATTWIMVSSSNRRRP